MTQIYFYSGAADKLNTVCRLSAKAVQQNLQVFIYVLDKTLIQQLDKLLWIFSTTSFIPHCHVDNKLASVTPVIIGHTKEQITHHEVLLNLHDQPPPFFAEFDRLVDIAEINSEDRQASRKRYRFYQDKGYKVNHFKLGD